MVPRGTGLAAVVSERGQECPGAGQCGRVRPFRELEAVSRSSREDWETMMVCAPEVWQPLSQGQQGYDAGVQEVRHNQHHLASVAACPDTGMVSLEMCYAMNSRGYAVLGSHSRLR